VVKPPQEQQREESRHRATGERQQRSADEARRRAQAKDEATLELVGEPADRHLQGDGAEIDRRDRGGAEPIAEPDAHAPDRQQRHHRRFVEAEERDGEHEERLLGEHRERAARWRTAEIVGAIAGGKQRQRRDGDDEARGDEWRPAGDAGDR
jgi:hypothetical protein